MEGPTLDALLVALSSRPAMTMMLHLMNMVRSKTSALFVLMKKCVVRKSIDPQQSNEHQKHLCSSLCVTGSFTESYSGLFLLHVNILWP